MQIVQHHFIRRMKKNIYLIFSLLLLSCNSKNSQTDHDYVETLEKKNKALEAEVAELKGKSSNSKSYFFIGSTVDDVIAVMGEPDSYMVTAEEARRLYYGLSSVYIYQGKVIAYENLENNLKVRVKK